ncbi:MAG: hypothetical protein IPJ98_21155 [Bryobacterales bacterium]|nr:hypothetical protein [Bryobacterales bacterium]
MFQLNLAVGLFADLSSEEGRSGAIDHEKSPVPPSNDLVFRWTDTEAAAALVGADAVEEDAGVAGLIDAGRVSVAAPFPFNEEMVIAVSVLGGDAAEFLAGDAEEAVLDGEDCEGDRRTCSFR